MVEEGTKKKKNQSETVAYLTHGVIERDERVDRLNGQETFIHCAIFRIRIENVWGHDCGEVMNVHLAARFFINVRKRRGPVQERKQDLHRIAVSFGKKTAGEVQDSLLLLRIGQF